MQVMLKEGFSLDTVLSSQHHGPLNAAPGGRLLLMHIFKVETSCPVDVASKGHFFQA